MIRESSKTKRFKVFQGGLTASPQTGFQKKDLPETKPAPRDPAILAGGMGLLYALGLLSDCSFSALNSPHARISVGSSTWIEFNELLCELRSLPWFDSRALSLPENIASAARRSVNWNLSGQLTLRTLFNGGIISGSGPFRVSPFWNLQNVPPQTLSDMPRIMHERAPHELMFTLYSGVLASRDRDFSQTIGRLGIDASAVKIALRNACNEAQIQMHKRNMDRVKVDKPSVLAAQLAMSLTHELRGYENEKQQARDVAAHLLHNAPRLMSWVDVRQSQRRKTEQDLPYNVFLPIHGAAQHRMRPSDATSHVAVSAAMATILKAVFGKWSCKISNDFGPQAVLLGHEIDLFMSQIGLARMVSADAFPSDVYDEIRLGQSIGLKVLRDMLERTNTQATLSFRNFDGQIYELLGARRSFGQGFVQLRINGHIAAWPGDANRRGGHLTAVI